jgi:hypothetical protein
MLGSTMKLSSHQTGSEELNALLELVQKLFATLIEREGIQQSSIERWRWDYPLITITWITHGINRNINVLVAYSQEDIYLAIPAEPVIEAIEVNVWKDSDEADRTRVRRWRHERVECKAKALSDQYSLQLLERSIQLAHKVASSFTEDQLDAETVIDLRRFGYYTF